MKITIDLEDLINDFIDDAHVNEYGSIDGGEFRLKEEIKNTIVDRVAFTAFDKEIQDMREQAKNLFKGRIAEKIDEVAEKQVERIIREDKFKYASYPEEKTLAEYIKDRYTDFTRRDNVNLDKIAKMIAAEQAEALKERYDMLFTSQLVSKLDQMGLLREDAAKILLGDK